jgi:hypothetical protein
MPRVVEHRVVGLAIVAVLMAGACDSGQSKRPVVERGGALRDGFRVAPNSQLVGAVFEEPNSRLLPSGAVSEGSDQLAWSAVLEIERDPVGVYDDYVAQARRIGVPLPGSGERVKDCVPVRPTTQTKSRQCYVYGPACYAADGQLRCAAGGTGGPSHRLAVAIELAWGGDMRYAHLTVTRTDTEDGYSPGPFPPAKPTTPPPPIVVRPVSRSDRPGTPFGSRNNAFRRGYRRFRLEPGSRVLADVQLPLSTNQLAVLQIEGSAETVLARYAAQLARPGGAPAVKRTALPGGGAILEFGYSPEGGGAAWLRTDRTQRYFTIVYNSD